MSSFIYRLFVGYLPECFSRSPRRECFHLADFSLPLPHVIAVDLIQFCTLRSLSHVIAVDLTQFCTLRSLLQAEQIFIVLYDGIRGIRTTIQYYWN